MFIARCLCSFNLIFVKTRVHTLYIPICFNFNWPFLLVFLAFLWLIPYSRYYLPILYGRNRGDIIWININTCQNYQMILFLPYIHCVGDISYRNTRLWCIRTFRPSITWEHRTNHPWWAHHNMVTVINQAISQCTHVRCSLDAGCGHGDEYRDIRLHPPIIWWVITRYIIDQ